MSYTPPTPLTPKTPDDPNLGQRPLSSTWGSLGSGSFLKSVGKHLLRKRSDKNGVEDLGRRYLAATSSGDSTPSKQPRAVPEYRPAQKQTSATTNKRPVPSNEVFSFSESKASIAIDISGSTAGTVIAHEISAISSICDQFTNKAKLGVRILPWNHKPHRILKYPQLHLLESAATGGTDPTVLNTDSDFKETLSRSSIWFLLTDGLIDPPEIQNFAHGIGQRGLHGTACVIILFGWKPDIPLMCNTSVGISVFAASPHCLFLFHAVDTGQVYIFQCKGSFTKLIPYDTDNPVLNADTRWENLPQINYHDLAALKIPAPQKLGQNDIALHNGMVVNLDDLYSGQVDESVVNEILYHDDDLKTVLLTSSSRGKREQVDRWVSRQKDEARIDDEQQNYPRPDVNGKADLIVKQLLEMYPTIAAELQSDLRKAHAANWEAFTMSIGSRNQRNAILDDCIDRLVEAEEGDGLGSPSMLSPVSPSMPRPGPQSPTRPTRMPVEPVIPQPDFSPGVTSSFNVGLSNLLYTPGYIKGSVDETFTGTCRLCGGSSWPLSLLLMRPPTALETRDFPSPNSESRLAFPLAMGNFPETHIISSFVCCNPCSFFIRRHGFSPIGEKISSELPLTAYGQNRTLFLESVDSALKQRFARQDLEAVFLAILYNAMDMATTIASPDTTLLCKALQWIIDNVEMHLQVHRDFWTSQRRDSATFPFRRALIESIPKVYKQTSPVLHYPLEGFLVLVRAVEGLRTPQLDAAMSLAVFHRFLYHLTEQYQAYVSTVSDEIAAGYITDLITECTITEPGAQDRLSIPVWRLVGTQLLHETTLMMFRKLGQKFVPVEAKYGPTIAIFLSRLKGVAAASTDPIEVWGHIRYQNELAEVFTLPGQINEKTAAEMVRGISS